ncbi:hypothetical protein Golob_026821, partial [Gossypium lobatum]|nr:hypothetical protein [Gossypium lobatum]
MTGTEIVRKIWNYIAELEAINKKKLTLHSTRNIQHVYRRGRVTVHFDTAFDCQSSRSATGLIVWNEEGGILASQAVIHSDIANPFTTEAYAGLQAEKLGISMGLNKMGVVGDLKTIIKKCQSTSIDKSEALKRRKLLLDGGNPRIGLSCAGKAPTKTSRLREGRSKKFLKQ